MNTLEEDTLYQEFIKALEGNTAIDMEETFTVKPIGDFNPNDTSTTALLMSIKAKKAQVAAEKAQKASKKESKKDSKKNASKGPKVGSKVLFEPETTSSRPPKKKDKKKKKKEDTQNLQTRVVIENVNRTFESVKEPVNVVLKKQPTEGSASRSGPTISLKRRTPETPPS